MRAKGIKEQIGQVLGMLLLMQLMFVAFQGVQITPAGTMDFSVATARADLGTGTDITGLGTSDPGDKITNVLKKLYTTFVKIGVPLLGVAIAVIAVMMMKGRVDYNHGIRMIGGGVLLGSAMSIAAFIINN